LNKITIKTKRIIVTYLLAAHMVVGMAVDAVVAQTRQDFAGIWKQSNERCLPKRTGDVTLRIDHRDPEFIVETTILHGSAPTRKATQRYTTDGKISISKGADGDEFHTSIVWLGQSLIGSVEEHEDGRIILSKEIWTLIDHGSALQRIRSRPDGSEKQTLIYTRQAPPL
jgi:hypothetical protein